jgi:hypothetical protein
MINDLSGVPYNPELDDGACNYLCHDGNGTPENGKALGPPVSTHSNLANPSSRPFVKQEENFPGAGPDIRCIRCHNVHGTSNLGMIRDDDFMSIDGEYRTIVYTSRTGNDSLDEGGEPIGGVEDSDDLCVVCHIQEIPGGSGNFVSTMTSHVGGDHTGGLCEDLRGTNCIVCHIHNYDCPPSYDTLDGFMPWIHDRCLDCHTTGGGLSLKNVDVQFDGIGSELDNGILSQHLINYDDTDYTGEGITPCNIADKADIECKKCHGDSHPTPEVRVVAPDTGIAYSTSDYFDCTTGGREPDSLTPFCMSCHDNVSATGTVTDIQFGEVGTGGTAGTLPANQLPPRHGSDPPQTTGPWNPNPPDPPPETGLLTYAEKYSELFYQSGHGSLVPLNPVRQQGPAYECMDCHDHHGNTNYRLVKDLPGNYDGSMTYVYDGESFNAYDDWCTWTCHARVDPRVSDHTDIAYTDVESGDSRNAAAETVPQLPTHPTSMYLPPLGYNLRGDRFKTIEQMKASEYIGSYLSPEGLSNASDILCITCHDPHGTNPAGATDTQMIRLEWMSSAAPLCRTCHEW